MAENDSIKTTPERVISKHPSDSIVQRNAEVTILNALADERGWHFNPTAPLPGNLGVQVDGIDLENKVLVEVYARIGKLPPGPQRKLAKDILKFIYITQNLGPGWTFVMAFASDEAAAYLRGAGWVADVTRDNGIEVVVVELSADLKDEILNAQANQARGISIRGQS